MRNAQILTLPANQSNVSTFSGPAIDVGQIVSASFQPVSGDTTLAGTVKLQMSNDIPGTYRQNFVPTHWSDIPNATSTLVAGVGPSILIGNMAFSYIRVVLTVTTPGTTTITCNANILSV